ncbi:MAG: hypothetical protein KF744_01955 [Taibaiella sp.]|nr:hypothetical protein [Taibaiella sp.]
MKSRLRKSKKEIRLEILESAIASFKIEGIDIPRDAATDIFKKIEVKLEKSRG